ncbi:MAG: ABC transporter substrate-binding protein, partial [Candidatus Pacebacteria bacterium]|nr:ABC transporter substrate-binding protein [Candidatus Paceibacterota bacterium]
MNKKIFYIIVCGCLVFLVIFWVRYVRNNTQINKDNLIRVGYRAGNIDFAPFYIADMQNYFKERGIIIEQIPLGSANDVKLAISMGQIDIALLPATMLFIPISKGVPVKIIAPMSVGNIYLAVRDKDLKTFQDLLGKKIALTLGGPTEIYVRYILEKESIDVNQIEFVAVDKTNRPTALMDHKIVDVVPIGEDELEQYSRFAVLHEEWISKGYAEYDNIMEAISVNENFLIKHPFLVEKFIDSIIEGHKYILSNFDDAAHITSLFIQTESDSYTAEYVKKSWEESGLENIIWFDPMVLVDLSRIAAEIGQIDSGLTLDQIFDLRFEEKLKY